jgi:hypothetical protein
MPLSQMRSFAVRNIVVLSAVLSALTTACCSQAIRARPQIAVRPKPAVVILGSLSIAASPTTATFTLVSNGVSNTQSVTVTTSWLVVGLGSDPLDIYGYFTSPSNALQNTASSSFLIPSSAVYGQVTGTAALVGALTPFTQATPEVSASGLHLASNSQAFLLLGLGSQTNTLSLQINLSGQPQLPAGSYTGTLMLQAVVN